MKSDILLKKNRIEARREFRAQMRQLIQAAAKSFDISSGEMYSIFREEIGDVIELEELEEFCSDE